MESRADLRPTRPASARSDERVTDVFGFDSASDVQPEEPFERIVSESE